MRYTKGTKVRKGLIDPSLMLPSFRGNSAKGPCQRLKVRTSNPAFFAKSLNEFADLVEFFTIHNIKYDIIMQERMSNKFRPKD